MNRYKIKWKIEQTRKIFKKMLSMTRNFNDVYNKIRCSQIAMHVVWCWSFLYSIWIDLAAKMQGYYLQSGLWGNKEILAIIDLLTNWTKPKSNSIYENTKILCANQQKNARNKMIQWSRTLSLFVYILCITYRITVIESKSKQF